MNELNAWKYLFCDHQYSFKAELAVAYFKVVFKGVSQKLSDQEVEITILPIPQQIGNTDTALNVLKYFAFIQYKAWVDALWLTFYRTVCFRLDIAPCVHWWVLSLVKFIFETVPALNSDLYATHDLNCLIELIWIFE